MKFSRVVAILFPIYLFKVKNKNTKKRCKISHWRCSDAIIPKLHTFFSFSFVNFEHVFVCWERTYTLQENWNFSCRCFYQMRPNLLLSVDLFNLTKNFLKRILHLTMNQNWGLDSYLNSVCSFPDYVWCIFPANVRCRTHRHLRCIVIDVLLIFRTSAPIHFSTKKFSWH